MIPGFHGLDLIVILVVALLIFGPKRLPEMGSAIGKSIKEFRKGMNELTSGKEKEDEPKAPSTPSYEALEREIASRNESKSNESNESSESNTASATGATNDKAE